MEKFDQSQKENTYTEQDFERIMADFENPDPTARPERIYNYDGTYTMEYIAHLANTPLDLMQLYLINLCRKMKRKDNKTMKK